MVPSNQYHETRVGCRHSAIKRMELCSVYSTNVSNTLQVSSPEQTHNHSTHLSSDDVFRQRLYGQAAKRLATDDFIIGSIHHRA